MSYNPDDKRPLFQRVVDKVTNQIRDGVLAPDDKVPSAAALAEEWDIANMTAQRALRELQAAGLTYGVAGRGSFVHPDALKRIAEADAEADQAAASGLWSANTAALADAMAALKKALDASDVEAAQEASYTLDKLVRDISFNLENPSRRREAEAKARASRRQREAARATNTKKK